MPSRIAELSSIIATNTEIIDSYNEANGLPPQSFDADALPRYDYPENVEAARQAVIHASDELHDLVAGPFDTVQNPHWLFPLGAQLVCKYGIVDAISEGSKSATYGEIANKCGLDESETRRFVRLAMTNRIFREIEPGVVAHTAASKLLAENKRLQSFVFTVGEELYPAGAHYVFARDKWQDIDEPNHTGFSLAHNTDKSMFDYFADKPEQAKRFADAMSIYATGEGYEAEHLVANYPWRALGAAKLVDVGGSHGTITKAIVERFEGITATVQDRPEVIAGAEIPPHLKGRLSFQEHDFFKTQPQKGADIYLLRWIFHDWSDLYAERIIRALVPALKPGAKIVVMEYLIPQPGEIPLYAERLARIFDIAMAMILNGREREVADWEQLFKKADPRFELTMVKQPPRSRLGILEFTFTR